MSQSNESHGGGYGEYMPRHCHSEASLANEAFSNLQANMWGINLQIRRLGMHEAEKFLYMQYNDMPLSLYGGPYTETSYGPIIRLVLNYEVDNSYTDFAGVFVDDYLVGRSTLTHEYGYMPLEDGLFDPTDTQPPIIWNTTSGRRHLFRGKEELQKPAEPTLPFSEEARAEYSAQIKRAETLTELLTKLRPCDFEE